MRLGKRRLVTSISIVIFGISISTSHAADLAPTTQDNWNYPGPAAIGEHEVLFYDQDSVSVPTYFLDTNVPANIYEKDPTCNSMSDPKCTFDNYMFNAILPLCVSDSDVNCLVGMGAITAQGEKIPGQYVRNFPDVAQNQFRGNPDWRVPSGGSGELFQIPGINNSAGNSYFVSASVHGKGSKNSNPKTTLTSFDASITPVATQNENYNCTNPLDCQNGGFQQFTDPSGKTVWGIFGAKWNNNDKTIVEYSSKENKSLHRVGFPEGIKFYLDFRMNFSPSGWLHGRLLDPNLQIDSNNGIYRFHFEGNPVRVPVAFAKVNWAQASQQIKSRYDEGSNYRCKVKDCKTEFSRVGVFLDYAGNDPSKIQMTDTPFSSGVDGIDMLNLWLPTIGNKASAVLTNWSVRTLAKREQTGVNKCFQDSTKITGIVTTNSTEYSAGPPEFDKKNGVLNYKVASPHFETNGYPFKGTYNLLMRNDVAKCLYGFKNAAVRADISVINEKGNTSVATTVFSQDKNWISLKAANFEFSTPTIKVKISQKK
jgi:hypothetical protein